MQAIGPQPQRAPDGAPVHCERHRPEQTTLHRQGSPSMNIFEGQRHGDGLRVGGLDLPLSVSQRAALGASAGLLCGLRPENVTLAEDGVPGKMIMVEPTGPETYCLIDTALGHLMARAPGRLAQRSGEAVHLAWQPEDVHLFDAKSEQRIAWAPTARPARFSDHIPD